MTSIDRYIVRNLFLKFTVCAAVLIAILWVTQLIREFDLFTLQGQSFAIVIGMTLLSLPALSVIVLPVALLISILHELSRLSQDSEYPILCAMGLSPFRILRPFLLMATVCSLFVAIMALYLMPKSFQDMRNLLTQMRASVIGTVVKDGHFSEFIPGITLHYHKKDQDTLAGIFIEDRRDHEKYLVYTSAQGHLVETNGQPYLMLEKGSVQRLTPSKDKKSPTFNVIYFDRYTLSLGDLMPPASSIKKPRELTTAHLLEVQSDLSPFQKGAQRAELHDRLAACFYPFIFALVAFACLGYAATARFHRTWGLITAAGLAISIRLLGFWASQKLLHIPHPFFILYLPLITIAFGAFIYGIGRHWFTPWTFTKSRL